MCEGCERNVVDSALEAGKKIAEIKIIPREEKKESTSVLVPDGFKIQKINNELGRPVRKTGNREFISTESFNSYVRKHADEDETIIIADEDKGEVKAFFNDHGNHGEGDPNWGDFTALLKLGFSKQFLIWAKNTKERRSETFGQESFAEFLEENRSDFLCGDVEDKEGKKIENVSAQILSKMILDLQSTTEVVFKSKIDPVSGQRNYHYEDKETGGTERIAIPTQFVIAIPLYKSADRIQVTIKLFNRLQGQQPRFWYIIDELEYLKEKAFDMICKRVEHGDLDEETDESLRFKGTEIEVLKGKIPGHSEDYN